jgi:hypothetical protein
MADEEEKIDDFVRLVRPFGIKELVRTGRVAMARGPLNVQRAPEADELATATARPRYDLRAPPTKKKVTADLTGDAG